MEMTPKNQVISSINDSGAAKCVDFFQRPDASFGYEEYRRDHEDLRGWFPCGGFDNQSFKTLKDAKSDALRRIAWLDGSKLEPENG
ncbi:MAG: hypothetical protein ACJAU6_004143 [Alphaproteobacteria bacterium]|jgi:hypothetical protein